MKKIIFLLQLLTGALLITIGSANTVQAQCTISTVNPGFELPPISTGMSFSNYLTVPGWITTEVDSIIEVWTNGYQGVPSYSGNQYIELNAYDSAAIYQDIPTPCSRTLSYGFAHRGRLGVDVAQLMAGPPGGPFTIIRVATDGLAWSYYTGTYFVPPGQLVTRFMFVTVSTSTGDQSIGNFLDSVNFSATFTSTHAHTDATCNVLTANSDGTARVFPDGCAPYTYAWNTVPVQTTATATGLLPGTYVCTITDANSCVVTDTVIVTGISSFPLTVNSATFCNGLSAVLTASGAGVGGTYSWSPAIGLSATTGSTVTANPSLSTIYTVTGISTGGCTLQDSSIVTVNQPATLTTSYTNSTTGSNGSATVIATGVAPFYYAWSPSGGNGPVATGLAAGTYTVTVTDGNGCTSNAAVTIINIAGCNWHTLIFDSYEYTTACPDLIPGTTYQNIPATWVAQSGTRSLYMNFIDSTNAFGTNAGELVYQRTINTCPGLPLRISTWITTSFAGLQSNVHIQIVDGNNIVLADTPAIAAPYSPIWFQYQSPALSPTTNTVVFRMYTNVGGGPGNDLSMDDFLVEQCYDALPSVNINAGTFCSNEAPFNMYGLLTDTPAVVGSWSGPDALTGGYLGTFQPAVNNGGMYIYTSTPFGMDAACPVGKDTVTAAVLISPMAAYTISPLQGQPPLDVTFIDNSTGGNTTTWHFGDGASSSASDTQHTYLSAGTYHGNFVVSNSNCSDTAFFTIQVGDSISLFIPNVFTPDGDSYNDVWQFRENGFSSIQVTIFNRWGIMIYDWDQLNGSWNGETRGGTPASDGIYYYVIKAQPSNAGSAALDYHGSVTLIGGKD